MAERYENEGYAELPITKDESWFNNYGFFDYMKLTNESAKERQLRFENGGGANVAVMDFLKGLPGMASFFVPDVKAADAEEGVGTYGDVLNAHKANPNLAEGTLESFTDKSNFKLTDSIHKMAEDIRDDKDNQTVNDLNFTIDRSADTYPVRTGEAIARFSENAKEKIKGEFEEGSPEYVNAMTDLGTVNKKLTENYYNDLLNMEKSGQRLTLEEKGIVDRLEIEGVKTKYSEFLPGQDIGVEFGADQSRILSNEHSARIDIAAGKASEEEIRNVRMIKEDPFRGLKSILFNEKPNFSLKSSDGAFVASQKFVLEPESEMQAEAGSEAKLTAKTDAEGDRFRNSEELEQLKETRSFMIGKQVESIHDDRVKMLQDDTVEKDNNVLDRQTANGYLNMFADIQAYNDEATRAIKQQFAHNPVGMQTATNGLASVVGGMTEQAFSSLKADNDKMNFLSEDDKKQLDSLNLTGVNVKFSEYSEGMDVSSAKAADMFDKTSKTFHETTVLANEGLDKFNDWLHGNTKEGQAEAAEAENTEKKSEFDFGSEMTEEEKAQLGDFAEADKGNDVVSTYDEGIDKSKPITEVGKAQGAPKMPNVVSEVSKNGEGLELG